ncbi:MAG: LON peptidase substrate-binding domain-containing protein [Gracilimonas sp.]|nr:LON peptidase substrate-binding domain-containing protein [Gracilimonas sp.]
MKQRFELFQNLSDSDDKFEDFEQAIPLMSEEEERELTQAEIPESLPILPLKNTVLFPGVVVPITVGRDRSLALVKEAYEGDKIIGVVTQKNEDIEEPEYKDLHNIGTVAQILKLIKMPDGSKSIVIQGKSNFKIKDFTQSKPYFKASVEPYAKEMDIEGVELDASVRNIKETAAKIINMSPNIPSEASIAVDNINSPTFLLNFISSNLNVTVNEKQTLLEIRKFSDNLDKVMEFLEKEVQVLDMSEKIRTKVKSDIDDQQREFYLRQQMKAIQEEFGDDAEQQDIEKLRETLGQEKTFPKKPAKRRKKNCSAWK